MIPPNLANAFYAELYQWSLKDWQREISEEFPYLRLFPPGLTGNIIPMLSGMSKEQRNRIVCALVKRMNHVGACAAGEPPTDEEVELATSFLEKSFQPTTEMFEYNSASGEGRLPPKVSRKDLEGLLKSTLDPICGRRRPNHAAGGWRYEFERAPFIVRTTFDVAGRYHQLSFDHRIHIGREPIFGRYSFLVWLGISGQTCWTYISESEAPQICQSVAFLCRHFLSASEGWFDSIKDVMEKS